MKYLSYLSRRLVCAGLFALSILSIRAADIPLASRTNSWHFHKGTNAPQTDWKTVLDGGLDATWPQGTGGFGYANNANEVLLCQTILNDMSNRFTTVYIRQSFDVTNGMDTNLHLVLTMDWDDGFIAWLNGNILTNSQVTGAPAEPSNTNRASAGHESSRGGTGASQPVSYDFGPAGARLTAGTNVLAIMGLNDSSTSSDFILIAGLALAEPQAPPLVTRSDTWRYHKGTNAPVAGWQTIADASLGVQWPSGPGGFGYGDGDDATILSDMLNTYTTVYIRRTFQVTNDLGTNLHAFLVMDWDDGFVAWLNGNFITNNLSPVPVGSEPAHTDTATTTHEAGTAVRYDLGPASTALPMGEHILAIMGLNESSGSSDFSLIADVVLGVPPPPPPPPPGAITNDTVWTLAGSPYTVSNTLTVIAGVTLTIEPGVTVLFAPGAGLTINGRLLAEGTPESRITFTRSGTSGTWTHLLFNANSTTSRVAHAEMSYFASSAIEGHNTALYLNSIVWTNSTVAAVDLHTCSIELLNSFIPGGAGNEPVHFSGMPAGGHALIKGCVFGAPAGYNDSIDFTGGNRPGPIAQFIDNVFLAAVDDCFDMDATDAHIEGNIFLNVKQDAQRDSSSNPITTGEGNGISELVICRNIFFNCEHTLLLKDNGAAVMQNNTIVHLTTNATARTAAGNPIPPGIILFGEPWRGRPLGAGAIYEGNIAFDLDPVIQANPFPLYTPATAYFPVSHSLTQGTNWPGVGNLSGDPLFVNLAGPMTAANIKSNLSLMLGSPCIGTGPNGLDMGALVPSGASISGVPAGPTTNRNATLTIAGPGIFAYRWRLDGGTWSAEVPLTTNIAFTATMFTNAQPITLADLADGVHTVEVVGKNSAGAWQSTNSPASKSWTVSAGVDLRILAATRTNNIVTVSFNGEAGKTYSLLRTDVLVPPTWMNVTNVTAVTDGLLEATDPDAQTSDLRFYRLVTPPQP